MTIDADGYRTALRRHPAGVAVITLTSSAGPVGFTATSLASLSLDPPLVSFNISHTSSSIDALRRCNSLVVNLLGRHQVAVAQRFSRSADQRFADPSSWSILPTGEPVLTGTPTWLRLEVSQFIDAGDSTLVIGCVRDIHCTTDTSEPLIYHDGRFVSVGSPTAH